jgi:hypothetical protein
MSPLRTGNRVKIVDREMTAADVKSGLFYDYFRNLRGTVERVYEDKSACVRIDLDSLPDDVRQRHIEVQEAVRDRWVQGLGQEQRERISGTEKAVTLAYSILVGAADLELIEKGKQAPARKAGLRPPRRKAEQEAPASTAKSKSVKQAAPPDKPERPSQADIEKAEEQYLKSIATRQKKRKR